MMIRYFCPAVPGPLGDLGYEYLRLLEATGIQVRALPIGPAVAIGGDERRWYDISHLFTTPMSLPYLNIVCAPAGMRLGTRAPMGAMNGTGDLASRGAGDNDATEVMVFPPELRDALSSMGIAKRPAAMDIVYEPQTAFSGLYTESVRNVAIVTDVAQLDDDEIRWLRIYDLVICPTIAVMTELGDRGLLELVYIPYLFNPADFARHLEEVCGFATPATTARSLGTAAPLATTWQRSTTLMDSSSRSPSLANRSHPLSPASGTSITSRFRTRLSKAFRTWKSFTFSLAFWISWRRARSQRRITAERDQNASR